MAAQQQPLRQRPPVPELDVSAPRSMRRAGKWTALLLTAFAAGLAYLGWRLISQSAFYMAKSGQATYGKVTDRTGEVLLDHTKDEPEQAIKLATSNSMRSMMTKAVTQSNGTGYGSQIPRFQTFAKTGTTSDNCDKWYCGGTPHYVCAVWYGFDYRADLRTGASNPSKNIFRYVFSQISADLPQKTFADTIKECGGDEEDATGMISTDPVTTRATTKATTTAAQDDEDTDDEDDTTNATTKSTTAATTQSTTQNTTRSTTAAPPTTADGPQMVDAG